MKRRLIWQDRNNTNLVSRSIVLEYLTADSHKLTGLWDRYRTLILSVFFAYVLGVSEYFHWAQWYAGHISDLYSYQNQLLEGHAPWLADQNRVLAPLIIALIQRIGRFSYEDAYQHFMFWTFIAMNFSTVILFHSLRLAVGHILIGLLLTAAVPMLLLNWWWFPWTNLEAMLWLLLFTVDALGWRGRRQFAAVAVIFTAMVFTKETAVFVPMWIVIRAMTDPQGYGSVPLISAQWDSPWSLCPFSSTMNCAGSSGFLALIPAFHQATHPAPRFWTAQCQTCFSGPDRQLITTSSMQRRSLPAVFLGR